MTRTTIRQHTFKNGSTKVITQDNYDGNFDTVYRVVMRDSANTILCDQTFAYLKSARELYDSIAINYNREKFLTRKGRLTLYSLCCGYSENKSLGQIRIILEQLTDNTLVVRSHDNQICKYFKFNELTKARKFYDSLT